MNHDSDSAVRASPGVAAAQAVPDPSLMRNHAQCHEEGQRGVHGD